MDYTEILSQLTIMIGILVAVVNIITEVAKKVWVFKKSEDINVFVTFLSVILTVAVFLAYFQIKELVLTWYMFLAFIVVGFMVAYSAMFGFDKLLKYFKKGE